MIKNARTPYDTGGRLEPQLRSLEHPNRYGCVDLDNDENVTVFTVVGKKPEYAAESIVCLLSIDTYTESPAIEVDDGDQMLVLDESTRAGLRTLVELAQRGRDDSQHQAETTRDFSDEDIAAADDAWRLAAQAVKGIQGIRP